MNSASPSHSPSRISCIICAFNEAPRISAVLDVVSEHPLFLEIIVVNDGSTDGTGAIVRKYPTVTLIDCPLNAGKSSALATGVASAKGNLLMLLDADLKGLTPQNIEDLASPVLSGSADMSFSLRQNSLLIFRAIGLDFVTGERVVRKDFLDGALKEMRSLPRFGIEIFLNQRVIEGKLSIAVCNWPRVTQSRKTEKLGLWFGMLAESRMILDLLRTSYPLALILQTYFLLLSRIGQPGEVGWLTRCRWARQDVRYALQRRAG